MPFRRPRSRCRSAPTGSGDEAPAPPGRAGPGHPPPRPHVRGGVARALEVRPDVALVDVGLPGLDGYAVARRIRPAAGGEGIRLVALPGYGQLEDRRRALEAGFDAHLVKPVDVDALLRLLNS